MIRAFCNYWKGAFDFRGATVRKEFWLTMLGCYFGYLVCFLPVLLLLSAVLLVMENAGAMPTLSPEHSILIALGYTLVFLIPMPALMVRRVRDARQPWWVAVAVLAGFSLLGVLAIGIMKKQEEDALPKGILTRIGYGLFLAGAAILSWGMTLTLCTILPEAMEGFFFAGMPPAIAGVVLANIGLQLDKARAEKDGSC